jgi:hypothetical protein
MMRINEEKILQLEDDFLDYTMQRHGHVYNAWKEIK